MASSFPIGSSVLLQNLVKGAHLNDKKGIVKSRPNAASGRQEVYIFEAQKSLSIKPANLRYEPRELSSLSASEMKGIMLLISKKKTQEDEGHTTTEWKGMDKEELRRMVEGEIATSDPEEIAELVAKANEPEEIPSSNGDGEGSSSSANNAGNPINSSQLRQGAEKMSQMTPDDLRKQAATMKAMGPAALRAMNPQMARMTDAQINMAISQMEAVANNPTQLKMARDQMRNMSESELKQAVDQSPLTGSQPPSTPSAPSTTSSSTKAPAMNNISKSQFQQATQQMSSMGPDQLRQQAAMLRSMPLDALRRTNPQMANMTDAQIEMSIVQLEQMAENPEMVRMAADQMKNMTEEQYEGMKRMMGGGGNGGVGGAGVSSMDADPASSDFSTKMMESLLSDPEQLNSMVKTMKKNPEMIKQAMASQFGGADGKQADAQKDQMSKMVDSFSQMDDTQLERYLKVANGVQRVARPALSAFGKAKDALGVSAKTLVVLINLIALAFLVGLARWWKLKSGGGIGDGDALDDILLHREEPPPEIVAGYADEF